MRGLRAAVVGLAALAAGCGHIRARVDQTRQVRRVERLTPEALVALPAGEVTRADVVTLQLADGTTHVRRAASLIAVDADELRLDGQEGPVRVPTRAVSSVELADLEALASGTAEARRAPVGPAFVLLGLVVAIVTITVMD